MMMESIKKINWKIKLCITGLCYFILFCSTFFVSVDATLNFVEQFGVGVAIVRVNARNTHHTHILMFAFLLKTSKLSLNGAPVISYDLFFTLRTHLKIDLLEVRQIGHSESFY